MGKAWTCPEAAAERPRNNQCQLTIGANAVLLIAERFPKSINSYWQSQRHCIILHIQQISMDRKQNRFCEP